MGGGGGYLAVPEPPVWVDVDSMHTEAVSSR